MKIGPRVLVIGSSGSGKSTLAAALANRLGVAYVELDAHFHGPNWSEANDEVFRDRVRAATSDGAWVVDGNYSKVKEFTWDRADTIVWIDLSFPIVFSRVVRRTLRRYFQRQVLWNGNRERLWPQFLARDSLFWWVIKTFRRRRREYSALLETELGPKIIRLRTPREVQDFLE